MSKELKKIVKEALDNAAENGYPHDLEKEDLSIIANDMIFGHSMFDAWLENEIVKTLKEIKNE